MVRVDFNTFCETKCNNQYTNSVHWVYRGVLIMAENGYNVMSFHVCVRAPVLRTGGASIMRRNVLNNYNNVHLSCALQRPERSHDTH